MVGEMITVVGVVMTVAKGAVTSVGCVLSCASTQLLGCGNQQGLQPIIHAIQVLNMQ